MENYYERQIGNDTWKQSPIWPDLEIFHHFTKTFWKGLISICKSFELTLANFICYWANSHCSIWQNIKHNLAIWSHWNGLTKKQQPWLIFYAFDVRELSFFKKEIIFPNFRISKILLLRSRRQFRLECFQKIAKLCQSIF